MFRLLLGLMLLLFTALGHAAPQVVVSIKPLHSLVAGVMGEQGSPTLLVDGAASPHTYALRPQQARALSEADLVVRVGPGLERFLDKPLASLAEDAAVLDVAQLPGLHRVGAADEHRHEDGHGHGAEDPHLWLDPRNAAVIARAVADRLSQLDPDGAPRYAGNAEALIARIETLDRQLAAQLAPVRERPFVVFHDAYRHLQQRYGLNSLGAITVSPERQPGARRLAEIRERIQRSGAVCVFSEPQFQPRLIEALTRGTSARIGTLDPLGADLSAGPQAYFQLMQRAGEAVSTCLGAGPRQ